MEPRQFEPPVQSRGEGQAAPPRPTERKRRFQLVKLEERIAPGQVGTDSLFSVHTVCHPKRCRIG
jgi:hypothetical protein